MSMINDYMNEAMNEEYYNSADRYELVNESIVSRLMNMYKNKFKRILSSKEETMYIFTYEDYNINTVLKEECPYKSKKDAIEFLLRWKYSLHDKSKTITKSNYEKVFKDNDTYYLYTVKAKTSEGVENDFVKDIKIIDKKEGTLKEFIDKYNIKKDIASEKEFKDRGKLQKEAANVAKSIITKLKSKYPKIEDGFGVIMYDKFHEDDIEYKRLIEFKYGMENYIDIIWCDAWEYTDQKARAEELYNGYIECFNDIFGEFKKVMEKYKNVTVDYYGDWDDGPIVIIVK